jgi:S-adenosylmethionine-diacylgycerolhomoserine-N-methlytransferase
MATRPQTHADLMDSVYRGQRHIYDATRKYFLFGRDRLINGLALPAGGTLLEVGCGTGRNLDQAGRRWPGARLFGLDISAQMLKSARARLGQRALLAQGDACAFSPAALFGHAGFDRVMISFALSMIPDWRGALAMGCAALAPGGALHVVDFGDGAGLPPPARRALNAWLARFHVTPRLDLAEAARQMAHQGGWTVETLRGPLGYYQIVVVKRAA